VRPGDRNLRFAAILIVGAGLAAVGLALLAEELGLGEAGFGWKRISLLAAGGIVAAFGALMVANPRLVAQHITSRRIRITGFVVIGLVLVGWLVLAGRQIAEGGFYSDDWNNLAVWRSNGYFGAVSEHFHGLGSKPLLAVFLASPYEVLGAEPAWHHVLAAVLVLATVGMFYLVLRELRFEARDALPIALLVLFFPWAAALRLWPTGSLNNLAVLLIFAGLLLAFRGLRVGGRRGLLIHVAAAVSYAASVLTYDATSVVALSLWPAYIWLRGWRPALPRVAMDFSVVGAAVMYSAATTVKEFQSASEQIDHAFQILRDGAHFLAASLAPVSSPGAFPAGLALAVLGAAFVVLALSLVRRSRVLRNVGASNGALRWATVAAVALGLLALSWAIYVPGVVFTPTQPGTEDRVNILALYPAAVFVYAVLRSAGCLIPPYGYTLAVAGSVAIAIGYGVHDLRQQNDWFDAADAQESVLAAVERASPPDGALVLTFGHPAQTAPRVPIFDQTYDLHPAARLHTDSLIDAYPVFEGAELECSVDGLTVNHLPTPHYGTIDIEAWGTPHSHDYPRVVFVDVAGGEHALITSRGQCVDALDEFPPGAWVAAAT
jgi:hypothetical protein